MSGQLGGLKDEWPVLEPVRFGQSCPDRFECRQPGGCPCRTTETCDSCGVPSAEGEECAESKRPCGHHCNHSWSHDVCCWCEREFGQID